MKPMLQIPIHLTIMVLFAPILQGIINRTKARFAGRQGAPVLQPWFDILRLLGKSSVFSHTVTPVFLMGPVLAFIVPLFAALLIPLGPLSAPWSFAGDGFLLLYLFALSRFFTVAAAMDTGSPFEGMGGAREVTFATLSEPTVLFTFIALTLLSGELTMGQWFGDHLAASWTSNGATLALLVACLFVITLVENCRIPFDDPTTHLELTMIHEVMVLDHSGPALALILHGAAMKLMVFSALVVHLALPMGTGSPVLDGLVFTAGLATMAVLVGTVESGMARFRMGRIPQILIGTALVSLFAAVLAVR